MKLKNPILFFILLAFVIVNIVDSVTAFFILPGEANPIYIWTGSIYAVIALKIFFIYIGIFYYRRGIFFNNLSYYVYLVTFTLATLVIGFAAFGNIIGIQNPEIIVQASQVSDGQKVKDYFTVMSIIYYVPFLLILGLFILYDKSRKYVRIDKDFYKNRKWWQP